MLGREAPAKGVGTHAWALQEQGGDVGPRRSGSPRTGEGTTVDPCRSRVVDNLVDPVEHRDDDGAQQLVLGLAVVVHHGLGDAELLGYGPQGRAL